MKGGYQHQPRHGGGKGWSGSKSWKQTGYFAEEVSDGTTEHVNDHADEGDADGYPMDEELDILEADVLQAEQEAFFAKKGAAGKGKGFRPLPARQFQVTGSLSLEERRTKVAALKARTTCRRCGARGHWSGDPTCPHTKGGGKKGKSWSSSSATSSGTSASSSQRTASAPGKGPTSHAQSTSPLRRTSLKDELDTWLCGEMAELDRDVDRDTMLCLLPRDLVAPS